MESESLVNVRLGSGSDFLPLIRLAVKAGTRRKRTESGRWLKTTHADASLQTEETSMHNESLQKPEDPRQSTRAERTYSAHLLRAEWCQKRSFAAREMSERVGSARWRHGMICLEQT
jgi:hypothetical protein